MSTVTSEKPPIVAKHTKTRLLTDVGFCGNIYLDRARLSKCYNHLLKGEFYGFDDWTKNKEVSKRQGNDAGRFGFGVGGFAAVGF